MRGERCGDGLNMTRAQRIREFLGDGVPRGVAEIRAYLGLERCSLFQYRKLIATLADLTRRGDLERIERGLYQVAPRWLIKRSSLPRENRGGAAKYVERMWLVMRNLSQWKAADIERLSEEPAEVVAHYIETLEKGGHVHRIGGTDSDPVYQALVDQVAAPNVRKRKQSKR